MLQPQGACYGFDIRSPIALDFLRPGSGVPLLVDEQDTPNVPGVLVQSWDAIPGKRLSVRLHREGATYTVIIGEDHQFMIELAGNGDAARSLRRRPVRIAMAPTASPEVRERLLWTTPSAVTIAARGDVALHAAAVEVDGGAFLLTGDSGAGKTTTAAAFFREGHRVLADDLSCCRVGEQPVLIPGPALLRVNPDAASRVLDIAYPAPVAPSYAKIPFTLPNDRRGSGAPVPLRGIVLLQRGVASMDVRRLSAADTLPRLWESIFHLPGEDHKAWSFRLLGDLVGRVPAWEVTRAMEWTALPTIVNRIATELR